MRQDHLTVMTFARLNHLEQQAVGDRDRVWDKLEQGETRPEGLDPAEGRSGGSRRLSRPSGGHGPGLT